MKASEVFPSKYLKAADLGTAQPVVEIEDVTIETLGDDQRPVIHFVAKDKALVANKTNFNTLVRMFGDETDAWIGKRVKLKAMEVQFKGELVMAVRISSEKIAAATGPAKPVASKARAVTAQQLDEEPDDEAINDALNSTGDRPF